MHPYFDGKYIRCDDLIPGMAAEFHLGVELGKLMYPSMSEHVPTSFTWVIDSQAVEEVLRVHGHGTHTWGSFIQAFP